MNRPQPAPGLAALNSAAQGRGWTRHLVNVLVALAVIAVAGATFVFSYDGVHAIALVGGVSDQLARYYPGLFDAVLVIACVAAVMLRDGAWWVRLWTWLVIVIVLGAIGVTDVLHAMDYTLRHRVTEGIVAAAPVAAVLLAFSLLLALLRRPRTPAPAAPPTVPLDLPALPAADFAPIALPAAPTVSAAPPLSTAPGDYTAPPLPTAPPLTTAPPLPTADTLAEPHGAPQVAAPQETPSTTEAEAAITAAATAPAPPATPAPAPAPAPATAPATADEPAPPTVEVPAVARSREPARPQNIRYASGDLRDAPPSADYWDSEETVEFAGLVFSAPDDDDETEADEPAGKNAPELDDDAPPFATAPFAPVPRLKRVRSTPTPPADEDE